MATNYNKAVMKLLKDLVNNEQNNFKKKAYTNAIKNLKGITIHSTDDIANIPGIGKSIFKKISDLIDTEAAKPSIPGPERSSASTSFDLEMVYGIGPKQAEKLVKEHKITTYDMLMNNLDLLNDKQKIGAKYYNDLIQRIPYDEMLKHETKIKSIFNGMQIDRWDIVGSFRRMAHTSGDIDVLIITELSLHDIIHTLTEVGYIKEVLALGKKKFMGIVKLDSGSVARRMDIMITPPEEYVYSLLYFTGSKENNVAMRKKANALGYTMNEHRIEKVKNGVKDVPHMTEESEVYAFLEMEYVIPQKR